MLNAFRHHRVGRRADWRGMDDADRCSTPFGITGWDGDMAWPLAFSDAMCSTPFGITGWDGPRRLRRHGGRIVLNAFRHHRVGRFRQHHATNPRFSAVLNAFRHHRVGRTKETKTFLSLRSAQRLSASQGGTGLLVFGAFSTVIPCSTRFGITGWDGTAVPRCS